MRSLAAPVLFAFCLSLRADVLDDARQKWRIGHHNDAIEMLRAVKDPTPEAIAALTEFLLRDERPDEALETIEPALAKNPNSSELHRVMGDALFRNGKVYESETEYKAAVKLDGKNARAAYGVARVWRMAGIREKAQLLIRQAHALDSQDPVIENAFESIEADSATSLKRLQQRLADLGDRDPEYAAHLQSSIAVQQALEGKPRFELASAYARYQIPMTILMDGKRPYGVGLRVAVGGVKTDLQLDTGAGGITITNSVAARAGVRRLADSEIHGVGNGEGKKAWIGFAESIAIGGVEFRNCIVEVADRGSVMDSGGLIGTDVFRRFLVKVNFRDHRLELEPLPGPPWDGVTPVNRYTGPELEGFAPMLIDHHYLLLPTEVSATTNAEPTRGLFLVDTGASLNMVSTSIARNVGKVHSDSYMTVKGLSGRVKNVYESDKIVLKFASYRQTNLGMTVFDLRSISQSAGTEVTGILGLPVLALFQSFTLDYRDARIAFDFKK